MAVVSQRFWRDHLGSNPRLDQLRLTGEFNFQVVGVMPAGFGFPDDADVWYPLELTEQASSRTAHNSQAIGRLKPDVRAAAAQRDLDLVVQRIASVAGNDFDAVGAKVTGLQDDLTGPVRKPLLLLLGASALLLLAACTNLASTLLARGTARMQELAVRTAIGAGRARLVRQIFTESLVIAVFGSIAGLLVAMGLLRALVALAPPQLALASAARLHPAMLAFTGAVALVTALLFGLLPALRLSDVDTGRLMRASGRGGGASSGRRIWSVLVAGEVAIAVVLLIGSVLLLRSFAAVMQVDLGFDPSHVLTIPIDLPEQSYPEIAQGVTYHDRELAALRQIPGVLSAGVTNVLPLGGNNPNGGVVIEGKPPISPKYSITGFAAYRVASPGYFASMGMHIVRGRDLATSDDAGALPVVVVNQAMVDREWPGENPIGKRLRVSGMDGPGVEPWATVVGVVNDTPGAGIPSR